MAELFYEGGVLFMGLLSLILLILLSLAVVVALKLSNRKQLDGEQTLAQLSYLKSVGLFALVTGVLGQMIGLYEGFKHIEKASEVTPALVAYGFRISSICNLYGLFIFLIAYLLWFGLDAWRNRLIAGH